MLTFFAFSALFNFMISLSACFIALYKNMYSTLNRAFAYLSFSIAVWAFAYFMWQISINAEYAVFWCRILMVGAAFMPSTFYHLSLLLSKQYDKCKNHVFGGYIVSVVFASLNFFPFIVKDVRPSYPFLNWPIPGFLFIPFLTIFAVGFIYALVILYRYCQRVSGIEYNKVKYVFLGAFIGFVGGSTNYPLWLEIDILPYGNIFVSAYVFLTAVAVIKYRLMDIRIAITNAGIFIMSYIPLLVLPFWIGKRTENWLLATASATVMATVGPIIYRRIRNSAEERFLAEQRRYQTTLMQAARGMVKIRSLDRLFKLITHICSKAIKVPSAHMFLYDEGRDSFVLKASRYTSKHPMVLSIPTTHPLIKCIFKSRNPIISDELLMNLETDLSEFEYSMIKGFVESYNIGLIVPAYMEKKCMAILTLGPKPDRQLYTTDDVTVFNTLAHQTALAIENCLFLEETQEAQEKIFNAEKLATLGAMASGLSHQLNNRLQEFAFIGGDLRDLIRCMQERNAVPEDIMDDFNYISKGLHNVEENVVHSASIIKGVLNYARTEKETEFKYIDIQKVLDPALGLLRVKHTIKEFAPVVNIQENLPQIYGSVALLAEAIFNLIDNAYEAIEQRESIDRRQNNQSPPKSIEISVTSDENNVFFKITDNGIGIKKDDNAKMYAPFFTTKTSVKSGTGLGMYVIKRIVEENHHGEIWYESEYMKYCTFFVKLPVQIN